MKRVTIAVPEGMADYGNGIAVALGGPNDAETYSQASWTDGHNLYAVCCDVVDDGYIDRLTAEASEGLLALNQRASPSCITVIVGDHNADPMSHLTALDLSRVAQNEPD